MSQDLYRSAITGPDLNTPFRVTEGLVVILLERQRSLVIPAGGAWPGLEHLPEAMRLHLKPVGSRRVLGTVTEPDDAAGRPAALALIMAQALTAVGHLAERIQYAGTTDLQLRKSHQATAALALGTTRETYAKLIHR